MKRTAICISGHVRTFLFSYGLLCQNLFKPLNSIGKVDIFIDVWRKISTTKCWGAVTAPEKNLSARIDDEIDEQTLLDFYSPKKLVIQSFNPLDERFQISKLIGRKINIPPNLGEGDLIWQVPMFYKIYKCNELKKEYEREQGFVYDHVIKFRADNYLTKPFPLEILDKPTDFYADCADSPNCGDVFWVGDSKTVDSMSSIYVNLKNLIEDNATGPEPVVGKQCRLNKIEPKVFPVKVAFFRESHIPPIE